MGPKTQELIETLGEIIAFLDEQKQDHWSKWMNKSREYLKKSDFNGISHLLSAYGGMGSFNDIYFTDESLLEKFRALQSKAYDLASDINRNHETQ